jgi:predicted kinase
VYLLLLTGPPGAGKSEVATALHDALGDEGVANALLEVDELERAYPALAPERALEHARVLCRSFRDAGYGLLTVTATIEDDDHRARLLEVAGADGHLLVRLEAAPSTLRQRIEGREPERWSGRDELVAAARRLALSRVELEGVDLVLDTERSEPKALAALVRAELRSRRGI